LGILISFDLVRGCRSRRIGGQTLLALLRPAIIRVLDDPLATAQFGDIVLAAQTMRIFSPAENCRVAPPISLTTCSAGFFTGRISDFRPICAPSMATMGQKSSLPQPVPSVS
jgi:hypothetical protein